MEKMNQVSVTEFMSKSKEEMYDMAVEMVEKYNRLVDICNDSAERIADLIVRHKVYTDALKNDIASKDAKIEKLEKEIEGRKECYTALKELMDTKCISTEEHNNICEEFKNKIAELEKKVKHQKENLDGINKTLEIRTKENESLITVRNNLNKEIEAHESENARLSEKIMELKKERDRHMARVNDLQMALDCVKASEEKHEEAAHDKVVEGLRETITYWRNKYVAAQEEIDKLDGDLADVKNQTESFIKELKDENARLEKLKKKEDDHGRAGFETYIRYIISEEEGKFKAELNRKFSEEVSKISQKRTEEELAKVKLNEKFGVGGVVDEFKGTIPCGEDAIE